MREKSLDTVIRRSLLAALPDAWALPVILANQNTDQGREDGIYFFRVSETPHGWQSRKIVKGEVQERQIMTSVFQFSCVLTPGQHHFQRTALDRITEVRMTMQSLRFIETIHREGIGVMRAGPVVVRTVENDRGQYEQIPHFDCGFTHLQVLGHNTPNIGDCAAEVERI